MEIIPIHHFSHFPSWKMVLRLFLFTVYLENTKKSIRVQKKRGVPAIKAVHESQGSLANVMWHPVMMWSSLDNLLSNHETYSHENLTHMPSTASSPPSELMPRNVFTCEENTTSQLGWKTVSVTFLIMSSLSFETFTAASSIRGLHRFPACLLTHASHLSHPLQAPGRSVCLPLRWLLINTWMKTGKGLLRLGR